MLLWIDTETTGLDTANDKLLEVALVVTTNELDVCWEHSWVLPHPIETRAEAVEYVQKMHDGNGLWTDCDIAHRQALAVLGEDGPTRERAAIEREIEREMRKWTERGTTPICGSTIAFDRAVLKTNMPSVAAHFHYRNLDVSVFTELASRWYQAAYDNRPKGGGHRALPDIKVSIDLPRYWRGSVMVQP
jgi:oligoribonuclease